MSPAANGSWFLTGAGARWARQSSKPRVLRTPGLAVAAHRARRLLMRRASCAARALSVLPCFSRLLRGSASIPLAFRRKGRRLAGKGICCVRPGPSPPRLQGVMSRARAGGWRLILGPGCCHGRLGGTLAAGGMPGRFSWRGPGEGGRDARKGLGAPRTRRMSGCRAGAASAKPGVRSARGLLLYPSPTRSSARKGPKASPGGRHNEPVMSRPLAGVTRA